MTNSQPRLAICQRVLCLLHDLDQARHIRSTAGRQQRSCHGIDLDRCPRRHPAGQLCRWLVVAPVVLALLEPRRRQHDDATMLDVDALVRVELAREPLPIVLEIVVLSTAGAVHQHGGLDHPIPVTLRLVQIEVEHDQSVRLRVHPDVVIWVRVPPPLDLFGRHPHVEVASDRGDLGAFSAGEDPETILCQLYRCFFQCSHFPLHLVLTEGQCTRYGGISLSPPGVLVPELP